MNRSKLLNAVYRICPVLVQNLAITLYGLILYSQRYGRTYRKYLKIYSSRDNSSLKVERRRQNKAFLRLLNYAITYSPFYKEFYKDIDIAKIKSIEDISILPILKKEVLKSNLDRVYTIQAKSGLKFFTGGTTGKPMMVLKRKVDVQKRLAYLDAYKLKYGFVNNKMRSARFFGKNIIPAISKSHVFWRNNYISRQRYYSTYYLNSDNLSYYVNDLNNYKPEAIDGFVSAIYTVAKFINDHNITLSFTPKAIFTTAETVLPMHRELIEKVFKCPLSDQYASNEGAPFIKQCMFGSYHEEIDTGVFEHIKTPTGIKLIVTSFDSFGTPLIRYDIEDNVIETETKTCQCGSCHPVIGGIDGRSIDYLSSKSRGKISLVNMSVLVSELPSCFENVQFIQEYKNIIRINIVINKISFRDEYSRILIDKMNAYVGEDMEFIIEKVDNIEHSKSGKFQMIINHMEEINEIQTTY